MRVVALVLLIDGATAAHQAMLVRTFRNDRLVLAELTGFLVGTPVTVALAFAGAGPWSIVIGRVVGAVAIGAQVVRYAPFSIRPAFDRALASQLVRFGAPLALSAFIAQAVLNVDYLIVGRELGSVALGVYLLAFNLSSWPASLVSTAIARVAFAGFSRLVEDRTRLVVAFPRSIGVAVSVLVPLVVLLAVLGPEVITFVYGERWLEAATPLRFLVVLGGMRVLIDLFVDLSIADGRPNVALAIRSIWLAALVPAIAVGAAADDLRGVGIAHLVVGGAHRAAAGGGRQPAIRDRDGRPGGERRPAGPRRLRRGGGHAGGAPRAGGRRAPPGRRERRRWRRLPGRAPAEEPAPRVGAQPGPSRAGAERRAVDGGESGAVRARTQSEGLHQRVEARTKP